MAKLVSINPVNGKELGSVKIVTKAEIEVAVQKAREGFEVWRETPLAKRSRIMLRVSALLKKEAGRLGRMISKEMGKSLFESVDEVAACAETVRYFAKEGARVALMARRVEQGLKVQEWREAYSAFRERLPSKLDVRYLKFDPIKNQLVYSRQDLQQFWKRTWEHVRGWRFWNIRPWRLTVAFFRDVFLTTSFARRALASFYNYDR